MSYSCDSILDLLLFSVGGVCFGVEAGQVSGIAAYDGIKADDMFWFHTELGYGDDTPDYNDPVIITIKTEDVSSYRLIVDKMEDVTEIRVIDIQAFPPILESLVLRKGMWGVANRGGRLVLLVDFQRFLRNKCTG